MSDPRPMPAPPPLVWAIASAFIAIELAFQAADAGVLPWADLRVQGYLSLAFLDFYFEAALAGREIPFEAWATPLTHAFLHGGMLHMVMNTVVLLALGGMLANILGPVRFLVLFATTAIAGGLVFGLLSDARGPLVGASGVIFGFIAALKSWEWRYIRTTNAPANRFWGTLAGLVAMNVVLYFFFPGEGALAWEAHLGGFIAGFLIAPWLAPLALPSPI